MLAAQAGFATPGQVLTLAAAGLVDGESTPLLTRLETSGMLSAERRKVLEALVDQAVAARKGDARAVAASVGAEKLFETLVSGARALGTPPTTDAPEGAEPEVPLERRGQYTRLRELGRGGQSVVQAARDEIIGREVALKELRPFDAAQSTEASSRAARSRFLREVRLTAALDHPGIVAIHELARREDGTLFCAQKLIRGQTLAACLARCESLDDRLRLVRHVVDACQAVAYAHAKRIVHRDLKPSNVMVGEYGETVVVDWGLAKRRDDADEAVPAGASSDNALLTVAGVALGTPAYMSPEQARGDVAAVDARSDVFCLGAILYQVLTGRPPFEGANSEQILEKVRVGRFHNVMALAPDAPPELAAIAERALSAQPGERYDDAAALAAELSTYLAGGRVRAYRYGTWQLVRKFASTHRTLTTGVAVALGALVVSAAVVALRLQAARVALASSFVERAYTAQREGDWARAAAYFAAAREQNDTPEARWGSSLAGERAPERIVAQHAAQGAFTDVGVLPDGRVVALGIASNVAEVRELEGGKQLWSHAADRILAAALLPGGQVRLSVKGGWEFYDAATGEKLRTYDRSADGRPCPGPSSTPVVIQRGQLLLAPPDAPARPLALDVGFAEWCVVADDGRQVAYQDASGIVQVVAVEDGRKLGGRSPVGLRSMLFSPHGLVLVEEGRLEVIAGPEGDFTVALPDAGFGNYQRRLGGEVVSPDGHLVVVARLGSNRADVVDLRTRASRGTLNYGPGWPRFAFSLDGRRVYAAGLVQATSLDGWLLPPDEVPTTHPGKWQFWSIAFSTSGQRFLIVDGSTNQFELYGPAGDRLASGAVSATGNGNQFAGEGPAVLFSDRGTNEAYLLDVESRQILWKRPCRFCQAFAASADASREAQVGADGLEVWDTRADRQLFTETSRVGSDSLCALSPDGRSVVWTQGETGIVRDLDSGAERSLTLGGAGIGVWFSPDSARIASFSTGSISLWDAATGRSIWSVASAIPDRLSDFRWSADGRALVLRFETLGTEMLDASDGQRLARFFTAGGVSPAVVYLQPDLRSKLLITETHWDRRPLPQPDTESPAASLARILARTGLSLRGVDLVTAP